MSKKIITLIVTMIIVIMGSVSGIVLANNIPTTERHIIVKARQFGYEPSSIKVNKGDKITIDLITEDVTHGFYLDGYGIDLTVRPAGDAATTTFIANKAGRFGFRCSQTCGVFHPFMTGEFIVEPNYLFPGSIGLAIGLGVAALFYLARREDEFFEEQN